MIDSVGSQGGAATGFESEGVAVGPACGEVRYRVYEESGDCLGRLCGGSGGNERLILLRLCIFVCSDHIHSILACTAEYGTFGYKELIDLFQKCANVP
eukprot:COSAG02_NODE_14384_length_1277_cov_6.571307_1_plen_98_part_00